jgi:hypothetical protein
VSAMTDCKGIEVWGGIGENFSGVGVTVHDYRRIRAVAEAATHVLSPRDETRAVLERAVEREEASVDLPQCYDESDAAVLADVLDRTYNGDDTAPSRAAAALRKAKRKRTTCWHCDGTGEIEE